MSFWKRIWGGKTPARPTVEEQMALALAGLDPAYSTLGGLLTVARKHRRENPAMALRCTQEALRLVQPPIGVTPIERAAVLFEHLLTTLFHSGVFTGGSFFGFDKIVSGSLTSEQKTSLWRHYDSALEAFMEYPSYGYPGEYSFELCGTVMLLAYNNGDTSLFSSWQPIKEAFYKSRGEYDVKSLISSIDEQQTEDEQQVESLFFDRRQRVSESAYKLARQSGVVPQYDPVCIYRWE